MGSVSHPKLYDPAIIAVVKETFHELLDTLDARAPVRDRDGDQELKAAIIRQLLDLVSEGKVTRDELRSGAYKSLPLD